MKQFQPFKLIEGDYSKGMLLVCDHASNALPEGYDNLGLEPSEFDRHIAYDIGAEKLAKGLAKALGVPCVLSCFSRLLIDPNRGVKDPTMVRQLSDGTIIPGNYPLSADELENRLTNFHAPYHHAVEAAMEKILQSGTVPLMFSVHTMTDRWNGEKRPWHMAWLYNQDLRMLNACMEEMADLKDLCIGLNEPYVGALNGDTVDVHCTQKGYANLLLEIRQDLVGTQKDIDEWVNRLAPILEKVNLRPDLHEVKKFGSLVGR